MAGGWYAQLGEKVHGPFTVGQLRQLLESGRISPTTPVRSEKNQLWQKADSVTGPTLQQKREAEINAVLDEVFNAPAPVSVEPLTELEPPVGWPKELPPKPIQQKPAKQRPPSQSANPIESGHDSLTPTKAAQHPTANHPSPSEISPRKLIEDTPKLDKQEPATRKCPYCAETILAAAIKCKHCGEQFIVGNRPNSEATSHKADLRPASVPKGTKSGLGYVVATCLTILTSLACMLAVHEIWANATWEDEIKGQIDKELLNQKIQTDLYEFRWKRWLQTLDGPSPESPDTPSKTEIERRLRQQRNPYSWLR